MYGLLQSPSQSCYPVGQLYGFSALVKTVFNCVLYFVRFTSQSDVRKNRSELAMRGAGQKDAVLGTKLGLLCLCNGESLYAL